MCFCGCDARVSIESGLEGRNNTDEKVELSEAEIVSIESGLEGRNNLYMNRPLTESLAVVSIESGLEGRNNVKAFYKIAKANQWSQ